MFTANTTAMFIHQHSNWHLFRFNHEEILSLLATVRNMQGRLVGRMESLSFSLRKEAMLTPLTLDVLKSTEIEGEHLDKEQVRSSIARRLGFDKQNLVHSLRNVDGVVEMMLDATQNFANELTEERLFGWHAALFPTGWSGMYRIEVHYQAPHPSNLSKEMHEFLKWINQSSNLDPVLKSAVAHFWFVTIHPFDDGNGRIARAIADMLLARSDGSSQRFYSMSSQILEDRKTYYKVLEQTQRGSGDLTQWIVWYLECLKRALEATEGTLDSILAKFRFWETHRTTALNDRQHKMLNRLLDGFDGKLTSSKWAKITKCSSDTALRDIQDLIAKGILCKDEKSGRSTNYDLVTISPV